MALKYKKRCIRCRQVLRDDGTCQNPDCVRYVAEDEESTGTTTTAEAGTEETQA